MVTGGVVFVDGWMGGWVDASELAESESLSTRAPALALTLRANQPVHIGINGARLVLLFRFWKVRCCVD